jgi:glycosyltransferase involved in cell wall biosynthesis
VTPRGGDGDARKKIGVLFVSSPSSFGADTFIHSLLMKHLDRSRFEVHAASTASANGAPAPAYEALAAIPDLHLRPAFFGPSMTGHSRPEKALMVLQILPAVASLIGLASYVRRQGIRIVHSTDRPRDAVACVLLAKMAGARSLIHVHVGYGKWMSRAARKAMASADALIGVSEYVARTLIEGGHSPAKTHAVLNAIDLPRWDFRTQSGSVRKELGIPEGAPLVVCVGRLFQWKGQGEMIRAVAKLRPNLPELRLLIVGEDDRFANPGGLSHGEQLRALARELGVADRVIFTGQRSDVASLIAASDVLALPSLGEPFGLVYVEAMAMKRPVIALQSGGAPEVVEHGKSGLLSPPNDLDALAHNISTLLTNPVMRAEMGEYGRRQAEARFNPKRMAADVERIYFTLAASA